MANILRDELIENNYVSTNNIDDELPPTHVVLYLKNISGIDKKTVIEPIPLQQVLLNNQNPSLKLIDNKAIFCLTPSTLQEISCEGATDSCELKNDSDGVTFMSISEILLNGISYTRPDDEWGTDFIFPPNTIEIIQDRREYWDGEDLYWDYYIQVNNLSDEFMRVEFIGYDRPDVGTGNDNPTLHVDTEALKATVCLAPQNGATDTIFVSLFDELRVSGDGWSFETSTLTPEDLLDGLNARGFTMQDSGDFMGCGDIFRIINMNPTHQRLKFESLNGSNNIEVLPQPNTAWSFNELPISSDQELNVYLAPNSTAVPIQGMQAMPIMTLFIPGEYIEGDESTVLLKFFVNDIPVENIVSGGYNFLAANSIHNNEVNNSLRIALSNSLLTYGILVDDMVDVSSRIFRTEEDAYKVVRIECDNKLYDYFMGSSTIGIYGTDSNHTFNIIHNTDELGYKAEFCLVNPQLPEGYQE